MRYITEQDRNILKRRYIRGIYEGLDSRQLLVELNISLATLTNWKNKDEQFVKGIERAERASSLKSISAGLTKLAEGYEEQTDKTEWIEEREDGTMLKRSRTIKQVAPNLNALMKLANKYAPDQYETGNQHSALTIKITQKDRSLTIEERRKILEAEGSSDNQEVIELNDSDIRYLESLEVVPPTKDQDEDSGG